MTPAPGKLEAATRRPPARSLASAAQAQAEATLRTFHEHSKDRAPVEHLATTIHPDAEMRLLVSFGEVLRGRAAIVHALQSGREAEFFHSHVLGFTWLDQSTPLVAGHALRALRGGGHAQGHVFWLDELLDGLVYRVQVFSTESEARAAFVECLSPAG